METQNHPILTAIFFSPGEPRLRAGWRLLLQSLLLGLFFCLTAFPVMWFGPGQSDAWIMGFFTLAECFAITISVFYARRFLDKRTFASLGVNIDSMWLKDIAAGAGIAMAMMGSIYVLASALGWISVESYSWNDRGISYTVGQLLIWLLIFILVGWQEELLSRGYHLQNLADGLNLTWGIVLSSAAFAMLHLFNSGTTWASTLGIFLAGLFLSLGYVLTKQLWLPIGLHIGWNFFEGIVFGFPVSGVNTFKLVNLKITGPELWTGGQFGPEGGLLLLPALLLGVSLIYYYTGSRVTHD
jgi:hypothetical protein